MTDPLVWVNVVVFTVVAVILSVNIWAPKLLSNLDNEETDFMQGDIRLVQAANEAKGEVK